MVAKRSGSTVEYNYHIDNGSGDGHQASYNGSTSIGSTNTVSLNAWHQVTYVYSGGTVYFYLDGVANGSASQAAGAVNNANLYIGKDNGTSSFFFSGLIDDPRIYNTALSAQDVSNLYAGIPQWSVGTANITAAGNITTNLMGTTLTAGAGKNISMTAGGSIINSSVGTVSASQSSGSGGNVTLIANALNFAANPTITTNGTVTIEPDTASTTVGVAGGAGSLAVTSGVLGDITAGEIDIGTTSDTGLLTANSYTWGENATAIASKPSHSIARRLKETRPLL